PVNGIRSCASSIDGASQVEISVSLSRSFCEPSSAIADGSIPKILNLICFLSKGSILLNSVVLSLSSSHSGLAISIIQGPPQTFGCRMTKLTCLTVIVLLVFTNDTLCSKLKEIMYYFISQNSIIGKHSFYDTTKNKLEVL
ncbi:unnamed protein product, partial [Brugia timori]|uniref:Secreted protein n=1 Tax=Brugia timori TaxID=42155 RepID=A0A0R3QG33_9BILA